MGRPSSFTPEIAERICAELMDGRSLRAVCAQDDMPSIVTVFNWLHTNGEFLKQYARAREFQADYYAQQIVDIADTPQEGAIITETDDGKVETRRADMIEHRRLQVDARKWYAAKLAPKKYGEKVQAELSGAIGVTDVDLSNLDQETLAKLANLAGSHSQ